MEGRNPYDTFLNRRKHYHHWRAGGHTIQEPCTVRETSFRERVTAFLRRQVPVRDEPPRSWLGGLPIMPEGVEWPRGINGEKPDVGKVPLHFLA